MKNLSIFEFSDEYPITYKCSYLNYIIQIIGQATLCVLGFVAVLLRLALFLKVSKKQRQMNNYPHRVVTFVKWRQLTNFPEYYISNNGMVKKGNVLLTPLVKPKSGYLFICVSKKILGVSSMHHYDIHRLVWEYFSDTPRKKNWEIHHKDFNFLNNHIANLGYVFKPDHYLLHGMVPNKSLKIIQEQGDL